MCTSIGSVPPCYPPPLLCTADPVKQARVNTVLGWHGSTLRTGSTITIFNRVLAPLRGTPSNEPLVKDFGLPTLQTALQVSRDLCGRIRIFTAAGAPASPFQLHLAPDHSKPCGPELVQRISFHL